MACNACETRFSSANNIVVSVTISGTSAQLRVQNQGRNIVLIRRILLCFSSGTGTTTLFLRAAPDGISWTYPSTYLEPGLSAPYFTLNNLTAGTIVQAQAEYIEIEGRSRSCSQTI